MSNYSLFGDSRAAENHAFAKMWKIFESGKRLPPDFDHYSNPRSSISCSDNGSIDVSLFLKRMLNVLN